MTVSLSVRKILVLAANPQDTRQLRLDEEVRSVEQAIRLSEDRRDFKVVSAWAVRTSDLTQAMMAHQPHIVHFIGHGTGKSGLVLNDARGRSQLVPTRALALLFQQFAQVECVLLNACYSDTQAQAICQFVPHVIGMNAPIGDRAAISFSQGFYSALGHGRSYEAAYEMGRTAIELEGISGAAIPILRTRSGKIISDERRPLGGSQAGEGRSQSTTKRIFISYRDELPDRELAQTFHDALKDAGQQPFMAAASIRLGEEWRDRIRQELRQCDYFLLLLSSLSATSEMVTEEVKQARALRDQRLSQGEAARPRILPIRVQFPLDDPLNYELRGYLEEIQQREWGSEADTAGLLKEIQVLIQAGSTGAADEIAQADSARDISRVPTLEALPPPLLDSVDRPPLPVAEPELQQEPGGLIPLMSGLYVERPPIETDCFREIEQPGALIRIKASRQMGKTSLMARVLSHAREQGARTITISFQRADRQLFTDLDLLLKWVCTKVGRKLRKQKELADYWQGDLGSKDKCDSYFADCILEELDGPLVLGLDEVDKVFDYKLVADDFFGLLRSWYESARYGDEDSELWEKLKLVVVHSTEPYVPLNINQSPFNVGKGVELREFERAQVQDLAERYGLSASVSQAEALMKLVGGHPYLIRKALYHLRREDLTIATLAQTAATDGGIYSDHLQRHLYVLRDYPALAETFRQVVSKNRPVETDAETSFKLESMGLVHLEGNAASPRCEVYRQYFQEHLEG